MQNIEFGVVTQKVLINVEEGTAFTPFSPVDENGEIANNGDAYGIVIDALGIGEVKQLVVMTAGCIDKICAEQHYGESYSAEAISALENIVIYDNHKIGGGGGDEPDLVVNVNTNAYNKRDLSAEEVSVTGNVADVIAKVSDGTPQNVVVNYRIRTDTDSVCFTVKDVMCTVYSGNLIVSFIMYPYDDGYHLFAQAINFTAEGAFNYSSGDTVTTDDY